MDIPKLSSGILEFGSSTALHREPYRDLSSAFFFSLVRLLISQMVTWAPFYLLYPQRRVFDYMSSPFWLPQCLYSIMNYFRHHLHLKNSNWEVMSNWRKLGEQEMQQTERTDPFKDKGLVKWQIPQERLSKWRLIKKKHRKSLVEEQFHGIKVRLKMAKSGENAEKTSS